MLERFLSIMTYAKQISRVKAMVESDVYYTAGVVSNGPQNAKVETNLDAPTVGSGKDRHPLRCCNPNTVDYLEFGHW